MGDTAKELITQIALAKKEAISKGVIREEKGMPPIENKEIPYSLPDGWEWIRLGDYALKVTDYVASGSFASLKENVLITNEPNYAIMVKTADFSNGFTKNLTYTDEHGYEFLSNSNLFGGELILSNIGSIGKVFIVPYLGQPMTLASNTVMVKLTDDSLIKYLYYYFLSLLGQRTLFSISSGTSMMKFNKTQLKNILVPVAPFEVQQEIVNQIERVSKIIELRKEELKNLDTLIKARFIELFGSMESKIPISEMCNVTGGYSFKSGDISDDGAIKILQIGNVYLDNVSWETTNYLPEGFDEKYSKFMLDEGDIVVALTRPIIQSLGNVKACIVKSSDLPCLLNQRVGRIVAKKEKSVFLEFIYGCLMTDDFTRYVESCSIGCSQPNISTKDIENYLIPNATYEKQKAYVEFKKETDKSKAVIQKALEKTQVLFDSLMQQYFG